MTAFRTRIGSVQMKSGGAKVHILDNQISDHLHRWLRDEAEKAIKSHPDMVGYALVSWARSGRSYANFNVMGGSQIPPMKVPGFVKDALLLNLIEHRAQPK